MISTLIGANVVSVSCGESHSLALTETGRVLAWGNGKHGRTGHGHEHDVGRPTVIDGLLGMKCLSIVAGNTNNLCVCENSKKERCVYSWGRGDDGRLGSGATFDLHKPERVKGLKSI
jgi:alpha-tubulin suppressor-like RCC1 family protein|tara:strand:+ start:30 stop:380 length:351 start_codon:yes stop_codon:yes gene_type:complete